MANLDLFVEDQAHEEFFRAMLKRLSREAGTETEIHFRSARGGHARVLQELTLYQQSVLRGVVDLALPDVLVVAIDANCNKFKDAQRTVRDTLRDEFRARAVVATPDPHVERWYIADPASFVNVVGIEPRLEKRKCERGRYKQILADAIGKAGHASPLGGIEFARELVGAMDLYRAGKAEPSLHAFLERTRALLRQV